MLFYDEIKSESHSFDLYWQKMFEQTQVDKARHRHPVFSQVELLRPLKLLKVQLTITTEPKTTSVTYQLY